MKIEKVLLTAVLVMITPFLLVGIGHGAAALSNGDVLVQKAAQEGKVRVLVRFSVPELARLQSASRDYRSAVRDRAALNTAISGAKEADAALASAIHQAGSSVFDELGLQGKVKHVFNVLPLAVLDVTREELLSLAAHQNVTRVTEDRVVLLPTPETAGDDDDDDDDDTPERSYGVEIIKAPDAWNEGYDGSGWYVAVLDTGVRTSHEMFTGKDIAEACFSSTVEGTSTSLCPNGSNEQTGPGSAVPPAAYGHGTHVAGIAVGKQPDGVLSGVAPGADLISIQVFSYFASWNDVGSYYSDQIRGMEYVYSLRTTHAISSVNLSLGSDATYSSYCDDDDRKDMIDQLTTAGIAVTVANGNSGSCSGISSPACISSAVAVGASNSTDTKFLLNNWHPTLQDIFAPGESIYSGLATGDTDYGYKSGTSMAAPHVAGAWAIFRQVAPIATVSELEGIMEQTGTIINSGCTTTPNTGPRLDVAAVLQRMGEAVPTAEAGTNQVVGGEATVTLDGSGSASHSGHGLTYSWVQTSGITVSLSNAAASNPSFIAPLVEDNSEQLVFELTVMDSYNGLTDKDSVTITVSDMNPPTADAGQDQTVNSGTTVFLDGTDSTSNSSAGGSLNYAWIQTGGTTVTLSDSNIAAPTFVAPAVESSTTLEFELLVIDNDNQLTATDTVRVTVDHIDNDVDQGFLPARAFEGEIIGFLVTGDGALVYLTPLDPSQFDYKAGDFNVRYLFELKIKCEAGATVKFTWQFPGKGYLDAVWAEYHVGSGWSYSQPEWDYGGKKLINSLTDDDADGMISLTLGVAYSQSKKSDSGWEPGCFVDSVRGH